MTLLKPLQNERGSAIMFAMFVMSLLILIAFEVSYDSVIEYRSSLNSVRKVQAYYAAKSCHDLSLLRIKAYQQITRTNIAQSVPDPSMLDKIWIFPLSWPIVPPASFSESDKDTYKKARKESIFKGAFSSTITSQTGRIDINDLGSPSKALRDKTKEQLLKFIQSKTIEDTDWAKEYATFDFDELFNHIGDWVDSDDISQNGGSEKSYYTDLRNRFIPPNQAFKTMEELHMVKGMNDDIFEILKPAITLYGGKGININYADKETLMSIDPIITEDIATEIIKRRSDPALGGPFKKPEDFYSFIGVTKDDFNEDKVPLYFDTEINFLIECTGSVANITREIYAVVYDYQKAQTRLKTSIEEENKANGDDDGNQNEDPCKDKQEEEKYACQCENVDKKQPGTAEFTTCVDAKRNAAANPNTNQQPQNQQTQLPPGPPFIIHYEVR